DRIALGFANLLEDDLLGKLRRDAAKNTFGHFRNQQLAAHFQAGIGFLRVLQRDLEIGVFYLLRTLHNRLHSKGVDLAPILILYSYQVWPAGFPETCSICVSP